MQPDRLKIRNYDVIVVCTILKILNLWSDHDSEIMGHFDPLPAKTRGHFPFKGVNEN